MLSEKFWEEYSKIYDTACFFIPYQELLEEICEELEIKKGEKILEAGCGTGNLALKIQQRGAEVVGLDNSEVALKICHKKDPGIELVFADLGEKLPFPNDFFDKIASSNTLYAIAEKNQIKILKELYRVLKSGGKIVIVNPRRAANSRKIFLNHLKKSVEKKGLLKTLWGLIKIKPLLLLKMAYYNYKIEKEACFLNERELRELLEKANFKNIETKLVYANQAILASATK